MFINTLLQLITLVVMSRRSMYKPPLRAYRVNIIHAPLPLHEFPIFSKKLVTRVIALVGLYPYSLTALRTTLRTLQRNRITKLIVVQNLCLLYMK